MTTTVSVIGLLMVVLFPERNWYVGPTAILGKLYSNTLLVSLNNRISIRDTSAALGAVVRPPGRPTRSGTFPCSTGAARSDATTTTMNVMLREMEKSQQNLKVPSLGEPGGVAVSVERVISEFGGGFLPPSPSRALSRSGPSLSRGRDRHRMILS
ncbi:hypothetical protein BJV74DRAFT_114865 [Russula compacta]|nr:hypothetical protein BJV74DRAFT_114865 [Russula compacta]